MTIDKFEGKYAFLSNFYECPVTLDGITYQNSEAAFQAQKVIDPNQRKQFANLEPGKAKRLGRKVELRSNWDWYRDYAMKEVLEAKFTQNKDLLEKLLDTGDATLIEGNWWNDTYWGICNGKGSNKLGRFLMELRSTLAWRRRNGRV